MNTRIIILAAGKGKRMQSDSPKVLVSLGGRPLISYLVEAVESSGVDQKPVLVVGWGAHEVQQVLGDSYEYVFQESQLGTGHAVRCAEPILNGSADEIIVLYGDQPCIRPQTIADLQKLHRSKGAVLSMMTTTVHDFDGWQTPFFDFGRVVRDENGKILKIVEKKDATEEELKIREVNPSFFCFRADWLWSRLGKLNNQNAQGEYYLTDLVQMAIEEGEEIASMDISPVESIGVNTPQHLDLATTLIRGTQGSL